MLLWSASGGFKQMSVCFLSMHINDTENNRKTTRAELKQE